MGAGYHQECDCKNNICKGINPGIQHYYRIRCPVGSVQAGLIGPFENDPIDKKDDQADAEDEYGVTVESAVVVGDHEIDLVDAEQNDEKGVEDPEIG